MFKAFFLSDRVMFFIL